jgi:hypothetical protein
LDLDRIWAASKISIGTEFGVSSVALLSEGVQRTNGKIHSFGLPDRISLVCGRIENGCQWIKDLKEKNLIVFWARGL